MVPSPVSPCEGWNGIRFADIAVFGRFPALLVGLIELRLSFCAFVSDNIL